jgi:hypothetical protein
MIMRWSAVAVLLALGAWCIAINTTIVVRYLSKGRGGSMVPLIGGCFLSLAWLAAPISYSKAWAVLPLLLDPGCGYLTATTAWLLLTRTR